MNALQYGLVSALVAISIIAASCGLLYACTGSLT